MENKKILYSVFVGVLFIGLISIIQINSLNKEIDRLENNATYYKSQQTIKESIIINLNDQIDTIQTTYSVLNETIEQIRDSLETSQHNSSSLKMETRILSEQITELEDQIKILDDAVVLIGRGEIENVLKSYVEVSRELEMLQKDYENLLKIYETLLSQQ
jgi:chromosome segregation ATPase